MSYLTVAFYLEFDMSSEVNEFTTTSCNETNEFGPMDTSS